MRKSGATYVVNHSSTCRQATNVAGSPGPPPPPVAGFLAWWAADAITGQLDNTALASWPDGSTNHHDLAQATGANRPTYYKTTAGKTVNGKPAVWFSGTQTMTVAITQAGGYTLVMVAQNTVLAFAQLMNASSNAEAVNYDTGGGAFWQIESGSGAAATNFANVDTSLHFLAFGLGIGGAGYVYQDGASGTGLSIGNGGLSATFCLGAVANNTSGWQGPICEVILYPGNLNSTNIGTLRTYLKNKWGTP